MPKIETLRWVGDVAGHLELIDQTRLPTELVTLECRDVETVWEAIKMLRVRGAPAIGIAAAYGVCLGVQSVEDSPAKLRQRIDEVCNYLATSRPTAVNLFWALNRMQEPDGIIDRARPDGCFFHRKIFPQIFDTLLAGNQ